MLALPTIKGEKSPSERFAGAEKTFTIEAMMQNGFALQSGTSHFLGQNFAKAFDVYYQTEQSTRELVWATSWGVSTRLLGALIMTHSDDQGLVLPPPVAPIQVIIVPIITGKAEKDSAVLNAGKNLLATLKSRNIRAKLDDRSYVRAGAKFFEYERKGVPLRIEVGPKDLEKGQLTIATRWNSEKTTIPFNDLTTFAQEITQRLVSIHESMFNRAKQRLEEKTYRPKSYAEMKNLLQGENGENNVGFYLVPWKCDAENEAKIKEDCKATIRCFPAEQNTDGSNSLEGMKCFYSGEQATHWAIFARAY